MSVTNRFSNSISKALNWSFNNSSNIVDPTRLRITDGTPLHSTGLRRFFNDTQQIGCLGIATVFTCVSGLIRPDQVQNKLIECGLHSLGAYLLASGLIKYFFIPLRIPDTDRNCFLTQDAKVQSVTSLVNLDKAEKIKFSMGLQTSLATCFLIHKIFTNFTAGQNPIDKAAAFSAGMALVFGLNYLRFKKVTDEIWTIEDAPPPKKTKTIEEKAVDAAKSLLPNPASAPALVHA